MNVESRELMGENVTLEELDEALQMSYSPEILATSEGWTPEYPSVGHCSDAAQIQMIFLAEKFMGFGLEKLLEDGGIECVAVTL